jgi:lysophospholipase L1-like esterase
MTPWSRRRTVAVTASPTGRETTKENVMGNAAARRRYSAFASGLACLVTVLGLSAMPASAAPAAQTDYVALGDSYTAGTGAGDFVPTSPCVQTPGGYADVVVDLNSSVNLVFNAACHGAFIDYVDPAFNVPTLQQQIASLTAAGKVNRNTDLVSLTAGANDAGVNSTLFVCATSTADACKQAVAASVKAMPSVGIKLSKALASIHRVAPGAKIAVLGYPKLFNPDGYPLPISRDNQLLVNGGTSLLNATLAASVSSANIFHRANAKYIDVTARFRGHAVNDREPWIFFNAGPFLDQNGLPVLDQNGNPVADPRNFHPNIAGHGLGYAPALTSAVGIPQLVQQ